MVLTWVARCGPLRGKRRGRDQVGQFFSKLNELQETEQFEPREFIAQDDKVVAIGMLAYRIDVAGRSRGDSRLPI